jgi:adenylate kinases
MKIILLGAPGAGKGTQAEKICAHCHIPQISTGNIIREAMKTKTPAGQKAQDFVNSGKLVPDEVVIEMVDDRLKQPDCANGFILDGFPRTVPQAQALESMGVHIDKVLDIEVPDQEIMQRLTGRRVCAECGSTYHIQFNPSQKGENCDKCGGQLIVRKDDQPETVTQRLQVYHDQTEPLKDFYQAKGNLVMVEGVGTVEEITARTLSALEA